MKLRTKFRWLTFASTVTGLLLFIGSLVFIGVFVSSKFAPPQT